MPPDKCLSLPEGAPKAILPGLAASVEGVGGALVSPTLSGNTGDGGPDRQGMPDCQFFLHSMSMLTALRK